MKRVFFYVFLILLVGGFLFYPKINKAEINPQEILNNSERIELKEKEAKKILNSLIQEIVNKQIDVISSSNPSIEEEAVLTIVKSGVSRNLFSYLTHDYPIQIGKEILKYTILTARLIVTEDISLVLNEIEKLTVEQAKNYAMDWLLQKEVKINNGNLNVDYPTHESNGKLKEKEVMSYIMVYQPIDEKSGFVAMEVYSSKKIKAPVISSVYKWGGGINELNPFIFKIKGKVEKQYLGNYTWIEDPKFELVFNEPVPDFDFEEPGFFERATQNIGETINGVQNALGAVSDIIGYFSQQTSSQVAETSQGIFNNIRSLFGDLNLFQSNVSEPISNLEEQLDLSNININNLRPQGESAEIIEQTSQQITEDTRKLEQEIEGLNQTGLTSQEQAHLTLEQIQDILDDISERIDILTQEIENLILHEIALNTNQENEEEEDDEESNLVSDQENQNADDLNTNSDDRGGGGSGSSEPNYCQKIEGAIALRDKIIINEVAWMGSANSSNDEWIELKNISIDQIDISNWQLQDKNRQIKIIFQQGSIIPAGGFYLLERTDDNSVPGISADKIYSGALGDLNEEVYLFNNSCQLQDKISAELNWPAGSKQENKTMERGADFNWHTYSGNKTEGILGTPRAENSEAQSEELTPSNNLDKTAPQIIFSLESIQTSLSFDINLEIIDSVSSSAIDAVTPSGIDGFIFKWKEKGGNWQEENYQDVEGAPTTFSGSINFSGQNNKTYYFQIKATDIAGNESNWLPEPAIETAISVLEKVLINEIQIDGRKGTGGIDDDWIELYNPNDFNVFLNGWSIQKHGSDNPCSREKSFYKKYFSANDVILAKGFFLIVDTQAQEKLKQIADMTIGWSLSGNSTVYLTNTDELVSDQELNVVDKVGFGQESCFAETNPASIPPEEASIERIILGQDTGDNSQDFQINENPTPINSLGQTIIPVPFSQWPWSMYQRDARHTGAALAGLNSQEPQSQIFIEGQENDYFCQPAIDGDGIVYFEATFNGRSGLFAYYSDGIEKWFYQKNFNCMVPVLTPDGFVITTESGKLVAVDEGGNFKWEKSEQDASFRNYPVITENGTLYAFLEGASVNSKIIAINSKTGQEIWNYEIEGYGDGGKILAVGQNNTAYIGFNDTLYAINPGGTEKWKKVFVPDCKYFNCKPRVGVPSIGSDGTVYVIVVCEKDWRAMTDEGFLNCLHAVNPENPKLENFEPICEKRYSPYAPTISSQDNIFMAGGYLGPYSWITFLEGIDSGGQFLPNFPIVLNPSSIIELLTVDPEETIYALSGDDMKAFDDQGNQKWSINLSQYRTDYFSIDGQGNIYVAGRSRMHVIGP